MELKGVSVSSVANRPPAHSAPGLSHDAPTESFQTSELPACCRSGQCNSQQGVIKAMQARDNEVRQHEQAHLAAAGDLARSGPIFEFKVGPDGHSYVVEGEVKIDASEIQGDPAATVEKMKRVQRAAMAPGSCLSAADLTCAANASTREAKALRQIQDQR